MTFGNDFCSSLQFIKRLNNKAAQCLEDGRYGQAIHLFAQALNLSDESDTNEKLACTCSSCSLDECISFSQLPPLVRYDSKDPFYRDRIRKRLKPNPSPEAAREETEAASPERFIYQQPIRFSPHTLTTSHSMGVTLPLIISFNLALAHHLKALEERKRRGVMNLKALKDVLKLYEISYSFHRAKQEVDNQRSLRFDMILANNLGEIHRLVGNQSKYQMCLELLLSAIMYMVDCGLNEPIELDGFFRNTSHLILQGKCAGAA